MIDTADSAFTSVPGVYAKNGVILNSRMRGFLAALRWMYGGTIVVTSGIRTVPEQAAAMLTKAQLGAKRDGDNGATELRSIYKGSLINEVITGGIASVDQIAATVQAQVDRGAYLSRHMQGDALDLRSSGVSAEDMAALRGHIKMLGANDLLETTPPHLHIEDIPPTFAALDPMAVGGAAALAAFLWWIYRD